MEEVGAAGWVAMMVWMQACEKSCKRAGVESAWEKGIS